VNNTYEKSVIVRVVSFPKKYCNLFNDGILYISSAIKITQAPIAEETIPLMWFLNFLSSSECTINGRMAKKTQNKEIIVAHKNGLNAKPCTNNKQAFVAISEKIKMRLETL
jgi:hypothetical protein